MYYSLEQVKGIFEKFLKYFLPLSHINRGVSFGTGDFEISFNRGVRGVRFRWGFSGVLTDKILCHQDTPSTSSGQAGHEEKRSKVKNKTIKNLVS
jgi:hypothetical protein